MWQSSRFRNLVRFLKIGDIFLILCLLSTAVGLWGVLKQQGYAKYCIISVNGRDSYKLILSESQKLKVNGVIGESIVEISNAGVRMLHSPCPLKICMHQGVIREAGQMIICVSNRIMIRIIGEKEIDAITW